MGCEDAQLLTLGETQTIGMGNQFGPVGEADLAGHQPLSVGQTIIRVVISKCLPE